MDVIQIAIVHYNTPELTEAGIMSLRRHGGAEWPVTVFDNSDRKPFKKKMKGVKVIDNTKGQVIDFEAELAKYPDRNVQLGKASNDGSVKHILSVQKLWELLPQGFILMESDILIRKDISFLWDEKWAATGRGEWFHGRRQEHDRLFPFLCYMNVPLLVANGARYFDPERCWNLYPGDAPQNYWDTGACLLDDIIKTKPALRAKLYPNLFDCFVHYQGGSWRQKDDERQQAWLRQWRDLWYTPENKDVKIIVCQHADFEPVVTNKVYETVDIRKHGNKDENGVMGSFYSELLHMHIVSKRKKLPKYIGQCQYRRYFDFMDNVPDIAPIIEEYGAITTQPEDFGMTMKQQYATWGNPEDLDIVTAIISEKYPDFAEAWAKALGSHKMHLGSLSIQRTEDWQQMVQMAWDVCQEYLKRIGGDIDKRVAANPEAYHLDTFNKEYARRVGGQFMERINSAWIDWKFPRALCVNLRVTSEKIDNPWAVNP